MNDQYIDFRSLWIAFDLHEVSIGVWIIFIALIELALFIVLETPNNNMARSALFLGARILLIYLPLSIFK